MQNIFVKLLAAKRTPSITQRRGKNMDEKKLDEIKEKENEIEEEEVVDTTIDDTATEATQSTETTVDNNEESEEDVGDTFTPKDEESVTESIEEEAQPAEKMLTQSQVNELVGKARQEGRDSALRELFARYGVSSNDEMDGIFGKGQAYDVLNDEYIGQGSSYRDVMAENALLKTNIDTGRWEDVKLILGGKGLEVNAENIMAMLETHPEWRANTANGTGNNVISPERMDEIVGLQRVGEGNFFADRVKENQPARLRKLGNEASLEKNTSDDEIAAQLFGI